VDLLLVHSSDLRVDDEASATKHGDGTDGLAAVLAAACKGNPRRSVGLAMSVGGGAPQPWPAQGVGDENDQHALDPDVLDVGGQAAAAEQAYRQAIGLEVDPVCAPFPTAVASERDCVSGPRGVSQVTAVAIEPRRMVPARRGVPCAARNEITDRGTSRRLLLRINRLTVVAVTKRGLKVSWSS
jgi:hypothetical protein